MWNLAQVNIARMKAPTIDDPIMADFVARLDEINSLAESSEGFVWRLKEEYGNATNIQYNEDPRVIINMSVWKSIEHLEAFTYRTVHAKVMAQRKNWFERMDYYQALWFVPDGHEPTVQEARTRIEHLAEHGPSPIAFTFKNRFSLAEYLATAKQIQP